MSWILVTGGAKHLGAEICRHLAHAKHHVVVHYNTSAAEAAQVVNSCRTQGVQAESIQGDFSTPISTATFLAAYTKRFPETKGIVNNVGNYLRQPTLETSLDAWHSLFQTNLFAPLALIQALSPSLKQHQGSIVNIGVAGLNSSLATTHSTAYATTKQSLFTLTKALAKSLAPHHVTVNMVSPGRLEQSVDADLGTSDIPMDRLGTYAEVAHAVTFLFEPQNHYITGQNIEVAGGFRL